MRDPPVERPTVGPAEPPGDPRADVGVSEEPVMPYPPRYWWFKRLTMGMAAAAVVLATAWVAWGWEADRRLRRMLGDIAAAGEPVRPEDVESVRVPDKVNAAAYLIRAAAAVDPDADCPSSSGTAFGKTPPYPPLWMQMADASVAASPRAFALTRQARAFDSAGWDPPPVTGPGPRLLASHAGGPLLPIHHLANTVSDAALNMYAHGDDVAALEAIRDTRHLARSVGAYRGINGCVVARNHDSIAIYKLQVIAMGMRIGRDDVTPSFGDPATSQALPVPNPSVRQVSRANVRALIGELLDERYWDADLRPALAVERSMIVEAGEWAARGTRVLRPMVILDLVRALERYRVHPEAASQPTWPAAQSVFARAGLPAPPASVHYYPRVPGPPNARREPIDFARLLTRSDLMLNVERVVEQDVRVRVQRRMAAVSLAAQLYRADHGDWPPDLSALVPAYLPAVPADPFSPDGAPLRYLLARRALGDGRDRPVVYSVNLDGRDDTPDAKAVSSEPQYGWRRARDVHLDLECITLPGPATSPSPTSAPAGP